MSKVTSKLQVTIPKAVADQLHLRPGDELEWIVMGGQLHVVPARPDPSAAAAAERLALFDAATARRDEWQSGLAPPGRPPRDRGWKRADLYERRARTR